MSQATDILNHILENGSITDAEAADLFDCYRLGARIYDLRKAGFNIIADKVQKVNGNGKHRTYARYRMDV